LLHPLIAEHLTGDDDPELWNVATGALLADAGASAAGTPQEIYAQIGCCHHWIGPHSIWWGADGALASGGAAIGIVTEWPRPAGARGAKRVEPGRPGDHPYSR
jgi:hypothetical protein